MTAREFLLRKKRLANIVQCTPVFGGLVLLLVFGPRQQPAPWQEQAIFAISIGLPYCLLYGFTAQWPSCPHCKFNLFDLNLRQRKKYQVNFCPHCSLPLDERMSGSLDRGWP